MTKKMNTYEFIERSIKKYGEFLDYSKTVYIKTNKNVVLICPKHGEFKQTPLTHLSKRTKKPCPNCGNCLLTTKLFLEKASNKFKNKFIYDIEPSDEIISTDYILNLICAIHGKFNISVNSHLRSNTGCQLCSGSVAVSTSDFVDRATKIHGNKFDYSLVDYKNSYKKVKIICKLHGTFEQSPNNHYKYGCMLCAHSAPKSQLNFINECIIAHRGKYDYSKTTYKGMFKKVDVVCKKHGCFQVIATNHLHGLRGCNRCSKRISKNEVKWLDKIGIPNDKEHRNVYIKINNRRFFVDGLIPETKTVYEYNGDYWHGNLAIYKPDDINPETKLTYKEMWKKTENRRIQLEKAGYKVISIWESDFLNEQNSNKQKILPNNR